MDVDVDVDVNGPTRYQFLAGGGTKGGSRFSDEKRKSKASLIRILVLR